MIDIADMHFKRANKSLKKRESEQMTVQASGMVVFYLCIYYVSLFSAQTSRRTTGSLEIGAILGLTKRKF